MIDEEERNKTIGVHIVEESNKMVFIKENGKIFYTVLNSNKKNDGKK